MTVANAEKLRQGLIMKARYSPLIDLITYVGGDVDITQIHEMGYHGSQVLARIPFTAIHGDGEALNASMAVMLATNQLIQYHAVRQGKATFVSLFENMIEWDMEGKSVAELIAEQPRNTSDEEIRQAVREQYDQKPVALYFDRNQLMNSGMLDFLRDVRDAVERDLARQPTLHPLPEEAARVPSR